VNFKNSAKMTTNITNPKTPFYHHSPSFTDMKVACIQPASSSSPHPPTHQKQPDDKDFVTAVGTTTTITNNTAVMKYKMRNLEMCPDCYATGYSLRRSGRCVTCVECGWAACSAL